MTLCKRPDNKLTAIRYVFLNILIPLVFFPYSEDALSTEKKLELNNDIPKNAIDPKSYGALGNGINDDTSYLQQAIDNASILRKSVIVSNGTYMVNTHRGLILPSNSKIFFKDAVLRAIVNDSPSYSILRIVNATSVKISGGKLIGDRYQHMGLSGEWGMGITISGSQDVSINGMEIVDLWGDGIYINKESTNIHINNIKCTSNRRQGISIISGNQILIENSTFDKTTGTPPSAGIDIEPNTGDVVEDLMINNVVLRDNEGAGIVVTLPYANQNSRVNNVSILNSIIIGNGSYGIELWNVSGNLVKNNYISSNQKGDIFLDKQTINNYLKNNRFGGEKKIRENGKNIID